jgi:hypothetical protein
MAAFPSYINDTTNTSGTGYLDIYNNFSDYTGSITYSSNDLFITNISYYPNPFPAMTKDEKRAYVKLLNKESFAKFLWDHYPEYCQLPRVALPIMKWGTANHQRPVPMLC